MSEEARGLEFGEDGSSREGSWQGGELRPRAWGTRPRGATADVAVIEMGSTNGGRVQGVWRSWLGLVVMLCVVVARGVLIWPDEEEIGRLGLGRKMTIRK